MNYEIDNTHQRGSSAVFEAKERTGGTTAAAYSGINRRKVHRRGTSDRRTEMRFQSNRRDSDGRRADDQRNRFW
jgi:hypothetical protein